MLTEWELLEVSQDIEPGDFIAVVIGGKTEKFIFISVTGRKVQLRRADTINKPSWEVYEFSVDSLDELDGNAYITGKHRDQQ